MSGTSTARELGFVEKRRQRMVAAGVLPTDMPYADTESCGEGDTKCALCDTGIKYLFRLTFKRPDGSHVEIAPVGSDCIGTWAKSMPVSPERDAFLARQKELEVRLAKERKAKKILAARGATLSADDTALLDRADGLDLTNVWAGTADTIRDIRTKARRLGAFQSDKQRRFLADLVSGVVASRTPRTEAAPTGPVCPLCSGPTALRQGRFGAFHGCRAYPRCRGTVDGGQAKPAAPVQETPAALPAPRVDLSTLPF